MDLSIKSKKYSKPDHWNVCFEMCASLELKIDMFEKSEQLYKLRSES